MASRQGRAPDELRALVIERGVSRHAEGSALIQLGHTQVRVTATLENRVPPHVRGSKQGWLMADYALLPRSTHERISREKMAQGGRKQEIQRLMGRAFRACVDLRLFRDKTLIIDADVLQADGGTRVASILGGYAALHDLADRMVRSGKLTEWPLTHEIGAVSVGVVDGEVRLDLDYLEDVRAEADLNVVATREGLILEVQGGTERDPLPPGRFREMVDLGVRGVQTLLDRYREQLR
ncbi:ribonuclease PH [Deinobacterium chartae]|uniref:Ribonuclease PH n=1 Tax=Deinobacterium chartae TaxID=521158 RepID=A0A841I684_9DEIO|nr:ribonuclease PH [Deinobacterium chartae]